MDWSLVNKGFMRHVLNVNPNSVLPFYLPTVWIDFLIDQYYQFQVTNQLSSVSELAACVRRILALNNMDDEEHLELSIFKQYMMLYFNALIDESCKRFTLVSAKTKRKNIVTLETIFSKKQIDSLSITYSEHVEAQDKVRFFHERHLYFSEALT